MKTLYELVANTISRQVIVRAIPFRLSDKEFVEELNNSELDIAQTSDFRYISFNKEHLIQYKSKIENEYKKQKFTNIIRDYFTTNHIEFKEEESRSGSRYFKFKIPTFDKFVTIRLSDHKPNKICASLSIRYDKYNFANRNTTARIEGMLDNLINRKSIENTRKAWKSKEH